MRKLFIFSTAIIFIYIRIFASQEEIGSVQRIDAATKEITIKLKSGKQVKMADLLEVFSEKGDITLTVKYPMMTTAICRLYDKGHLSAVRSNMPVYVHATGQVKNSAAVENKTGERFTEISSIIVNDNRTGLMWLKDADMPSEIITWSDAKQFVANLKIEGYSDWRLPEKEELDELLKTREEELKKNFRNIRNFYWTATEHDKYPQYAWIAGVDGPTLSYNYKTYNNSVWAVRGSRTAVKNAPGKEEPSDDPVKSFAIHTCKKYSESYVSHKTELDEMTISKYEIRCRKGTSDSTRVIGYDKLMGTWSE